MFVILAGKHDLKDYLIKIVASDKYSVDQLIHQTF